jgi:hypothetical protein
MAFRAKVRAAIAPLAMAALCGCPKRSAVWIADGARPGQPMFGVGAARHGRPLGQLLFLGVGKCDEYDGTGPTAVWFVSLVEDVRAPRAIVFGDSVPRGYAVGKGPNRLEPGCYEARVDGSGRVRFVVREDGSSVEVRRE